MWHNVYRVLPRPVLPYAKLNRPILTLPSADLHNIIPASELDFHCHLPMCIFQMASKGSSKNSRQLADLACSHLMLVITAGYVAKANNDFANR